MKKTLSILLAAVLLLNSLTLGAAALSNSSIILSSDVDITTDNSAVITENILYEGTTRESEKFITYKPNTNTYPMVFYGNKLYGRQTMSSAVNQLSARGVTPIAGINADFFSLQTGLPLGMVMEDGVISSSSTQEKAIAFFADGSSYIGTPAPVTNFVYMEQSYKIDHINKLRQPYGLYLMTDKFSANTRTWSAGLDIIFKPDSMDLGFKKSVTGTVVDTCYSDSAIAIPEGCWVLTIDINGPADRLEVMKTMVAGDVIEINTAPSDPNFTEARYIVGGAEQLITEGVPTPNLGSDIAPRTAVGIKADGSTIFYTVDGRQSGHSVGMSLTALANRLLQLGCVSALNLDGGGSTTFGVSYPGDSTFSVINSPSDGAQRQCSNFLFIVKPTTTPTYATSLFIKPVNKTVLVNTPVKLSAKGIDYNMNEAPLSAPVVYTSDDGVINGDEFIPTKTGKARIYAYSGNVSGYLTVNVTDAVSSLEIHRNGSNITTLTVDPNNTIQLTAVAGTSPYKATYDNRSFNWSVSGDVGTIDQSGQFTSGRTGGSGTITLTYGTKSVSIPVVITEKTYLIEDFEKDTAIFTPSDEMFALTDKSIVKKGRQSIKLSYALSDSLQGVASVTSNININSSSEYLCLYVYGDNSTNELYFTMGSTEIPVTKLDFTGWKFFAVKLPLDATKLDKISIKGTKSGQIYLDQMVCSYTHIEDTTAPEIAFDTNSGEKVTVHLPAEQLASLKVHLNSNEITYTQSDSSITVSPVLSDGINRLSVIATDNYGNISKISCDLTKENPEVINPFEDTVDHWAANYANYLFNKNIATGELMDTGIRLYRPNNNMTRAEFATLITKYLSYDLQSYADVPLHYTDSIPDWASNAIKAAYENGIITGSNDLSGKLVFRANDPITRAEVVTIIGRTLIKGYPQKNLDFKDSADIPDWSAEHFKTLCYLNVISGYDDKTIKPLKNITKGEAAKILYTLF